MPVRYANAQWNGNLKEGKGTMKIGAHEFPYSAGSRFEGEKGSNPEELLGAAHAGCFSMALSAELAAAGHNPKQVSSTADVRIDPVSGGFKITSITLNTEADVPGIDADTFNKIAEGAKTNCPVSQALAAVEIKLNATLK